MRCGWRRLVHQAIEASQGEREMRAALVVGHGVNLVDDEGA